MRRAVLAIFAVLAGAVSCRAGDMETVAFPSADEEKTQITGYLFKPEGPGPFPAVVALHGCGGLFTKRGDRFTGRHRDWAERLVKAGYAVLFPDSYGSRDLPAQCNVKKREITPRGRAADAQGAADWLSSQRYIDAKSLALLGWSNGGSTVLWSMAPEARPQKADFRVAFAFYPGCRVPLEKTTWAARLPLTILIGEADDWTPAEPCRQLASRWGSQYKGFEGAYHDFDAPNLPVRTKRGVAFSARGDGVVHTGTNETAREAAIAYVMETLKREIGRADAPPAAGGQ